MANTIERPPILPATGQFPAGVVLRTDQYSLICETLNYAIAELHAEQAFQQSFYDDICSASTTVYVEEPVCVWCVPITSDVFNSIRIYIRGYYKDAALGGEVLFESVGNDADTSIVLPGDEDNARSDFSLTTTLDIAAVDEDGYDLIKMYLKSNNAAGKVIIEHVYAEYLSKFDEDEVIDALQYDGAYALGLGASASADAPLPASRGFQIIDIIEALADRPRCFISWSAIAPFYYAGSGGGYITWNVPTLGETPWQVLHGDQIATRSFSLYADSQFAADVAVGIPRGTTVRMGAGAHVEDFTLPRRQRIAIVGNPGIAKHKSLALWGR